MTGIVAAAQYSIAAVNPVTVQLHNQAISEYGAMPVVATYIIANNGTVQDGSGDVLESWLTGTGASVSDYEVAAAQTSGAAVSGTLGTWMNCSTSVSWSVANTNRAPSVKSAVISVQIRDTATHNVKASASITLTAQTDGS